MKEHNVYTRPVQTVTDTEQLLAVFDQTFLLLQRDKVPLSAGTKLRVPVLISVQTKHVSCDKQIT